MSALTNPNRRKPMGKHAQTLIDNPEIAMYDPAEAELLRELERLGVVNDPPPDSDTCPKCGSPLTGCSGFVGENMIWCTAAECTYTWMDSEGAIRNCI